MNSQPIEIEQVFDVPVSRVWDAITNNEQMKLWYFKLPEFKAIPGFEFSFVAGAEGDLQYKHICRVTEVVPKKKLSYSWRYEGYAGDSMVIFELFAEGETTRMKLTHSGLETFADAGAAFSRDNFATGWTHIIGTSLKNFLEPEPARA
jgi:uncharacterized protein YndB with AHSA1/START domain